jgi:hypothetical protein
LTSLTICSSNGEHSQIILQVAGVECGIDGVVFHLHRGINYCQNIVKKGGRKFVEKLALKTVVLIQDNNKSLMA